MTRIRKKYAKCINCQYSFVGENQFCPKCGQKNQDIKISIHFLIEELIEGLFHFDNKFWTTIKSLFSSPGKITLEYLQGKRSSFVPPIRLFIFLGLIYYIALSTTKIDYVNSKNSDFNNRYINLSFTKDTNESKTLTKIDNEAIAFDLQSNKALNSDLLSYLKAKLDTNLNKINNTTLYSKFLKSFSYIFYFLFPVLAIFLKFFFRKSYYSEHIIFSLHFHSILFVGLSIFNVGILFIKNYYFDTFLFFGLGVYLIISLKKVFNNSWAFTTLNGIVIGILYIISLVSLTFLALAWTILFIN